MVCSRISVVDLNGLKSCFSSLLAGLGGLSCRKPFLCCISDASRFSLIMSSGYRASMARSTVGAVMGDSLALRFVIMGREVLNVDGAAWSFLRLLRKVPTSMFLSFDSFGTRLISCFAVTVEASDGRSFLWPDVSCPPRTKLSSPRVGCEGAFV